MNPHHALHLLRRLLLAVFCGLLPQAAFSVDGEVKPPDWQLSKDGSHIIHRSARAAWPRCVEGMQWTGRRCSGKALWLDYGEALALARERQKADGIAWRLPLAKELQQLAVQNELSSKAGQALIPTVDHNWCWSATVSVGLRSSNPFNYANVQRGVTERTSNQLAILHGWAVNTATAEAQGNILKRTQMPVRLVRPIDE
jgi:hypothetical protein